MIIGSGKVDGRKVYLTADDFSVRGGHADGGIQGKAAFGEVSMSRRSLSSLTVIFVQALAFKHKVPLVRFLQTNCAVPLLRILRFVCWMDPAEVVVLPSVRTVTPLNRNSFSNIPLQTCL